MSTLPDCQSQTKSNDGSQFQSQTNYSQEQETQINQITEQTFINSTPPPPATNKQNAVLNHTVPFSKTKPGSAARQAYIQQLQRKHGNSFVQRSVSQYNNSSSNLISAKTTPQFTQPQQPAVPASIIQRCACGKTKAEEETSCESCQSNSALSNPDLTPLPLLRSFEDPSTPLSFNHATKTGLQRDFLDDVGGVWNNVTNGKGDSILNSLNNLSQNNLAMLLRPISPVLANFIDNGPTEFIQKNLENILQTELDALFKPITLTAIVDNSVNYLTHLLTSLNDMFNSDAQACANFNQMLKGITEFLQQMFNNPFTNSLKGSLEGFGGVISTISDVVVAPVFNILSNQLSGAGRIVSSLADTISSWITQVQGVAAPLWDFVSKKLGINDSSPSGVLKWVNEQLDNIWAIIKQKLVPVIEPLRKLKSILNLFNSMEQISFIVNNGPKLVQIIQWLWQHKNDPDIISSAHREMSHTILPQLLQEFATFKSNLQTGFEWLLNQLGALSDGLLELLSTTTGLPLLNKAHQAVQNLSNDIKKLITISEAKLKAIKDVIQIIATKLKDFIEPYKEVLSSLALATINPSTIPYILAGWAWRKLPECLKGPIIDFLLDSLSGVLRTMPNLPALGIAWSLVKAGVLGFLQTVKEQPLVSKIKISDKLAKIASGASLDFMLGFAKGFLRGIWDGIADPLKAIWLVLEGLTKVNEYLEKLAKEAFTQVSPSHNKNSGQQKTDSQNQQLSERVQEMVAELASPTKTIQMNFWGAIKEYFAESNGMTFDELAKKLGNIWQTLETKLKETGNELGNKFCEFFLNDKAEGEVGDGVGWLAGTIAFQALLDFISAGGWEAAGPIIKGLAKFLNWPMEALGEAFKLLGKLGGVLNTAIKGLASKITHAGPLKQVVQAIKTIGSKLVIFAEELLVKFGRGIAHDAENAGLHGGLKTATKNAENTALKEAETLSGIEARKIEFTNSLGEEHEITFLDGKLIRCSNDCELIANNVNMRITNLANNHALENATKVQLVQLQNKATTLTERAMKTAKLPAGAFREKLEDQLLSEARFLENQLAEIEGKLGLPRTASVVDPHDPARISKLESDPQTGLKEPKSISEAQSILQAEEMGLVINARRPNLANGEQNVDFVIANKQVGKDTFTVADIKTPVSAKFESITKQVERIGFSIKKYDRDVMVIIDLKNLSSAEKAEFLRQLHSDSTLDLTSVRFLNQ